MNHSSPAVSGTPSVVGKDGAGRDSVSAAQTSDPAPADLSEEYRNVLAAYERGKKAKAAGHGLSTLLREAFFWEAGYYGDPMPEFSNWEDL